MAKNNLEALTQEGDRFKKLSELLERIRTDSYNPRNVPDFIDYMESAGEGELPPEVMQVLPEELNNPGRLRQMAELSAQYEQGKLVEEVSKDYTSLVDALSEDKLQNLAVAVPEKGKNFQAIFEALRKGDAEYARKAYIGACKNPIWALFVKTAKAKFIGDFAQLYAGMQQRKFIEQYTTERTKDGQKVLVLDPQKLRNYIKTTVAGYKDSNLTNSIYLDSAKLYLDIQDEEQQDERGYRGRGRRRAA